MIINSHRSSFLATHDGILRSGYALPLIHRHLSMPIFRQGVIQAHKYLSYCELNSIYKYWTVR